MRAAILAAVSLIMPLLAFPAPALGIGQAPVLTLSLAPPMRTVYGNGSTFVSVTFSGIASVTLGSFDRSTYTLSLSGAVQTGWVVSVTPETFTYTSTGDQGFCCTVVVPESSGNASTIVTVTGYLTGGGFTVSNTASSRLDVKITDPNARVAGQDGAYFDWAATLRSYTMICVPILVVIVVATGWGIHRWRRSRKRKAAGAGKSPAR